MRTGNKRVIRPIAGDPVELEPVGGRLVLRIGDVETELGEGGAAVLRRSLASIACALGWGPSRRGRRGGAGRTPSVAQDGRAARDEAEAAERSEPGYSAPWGRLPPAPRQPGRPRGKVRP